MPILINADVNDAGMLFSQPDKATQNYLRNEVNNFVSSLGQAGSHIANKVMSAYKDITSGKTFRRIQAIKNLSNSFFEENSVRKLKTLGELQTAPDIMIPYLMANPEVHELYQDDRIKGYGDNYNTNPYGRAGLNNQHYRQAVNTMVIKEEVDGETSYICRNTYSKAQEEMDDLTFVDKANVLSSWKLMNYTHQEHGIDATSEENDLIE